MVPDHSYLGGEFMVISNLLSCFLFSRMDVNQSFDNEISHSI